MHPEIFGKADPAQMKPCINTEIAFLNLLILITVQESYKETHLIRIFSRSKTIRKIGNGCPPLEGAKGVDSLMCWFTIDYISYLE